MLIFGCGRTFFIDFFCKRLDNLIAMIVTCHIRSFISYCEYLKSFQFRSNVMRMHHSIICQNLVPVWTFLKSLYTKKNWQSSRFRNTTFYLSCVTFIFPSKWKRIGLIICRLFRCSKFVLIGLIQNYFKIGKFWEGLCLQRMF